MKSKNPEKQQQQNQSSQHSAHSGMWQGRFWSTMWQALESTRTTCTTTYTGQGNQCHRHCERYFENEDLQIWGFDRRLPPWAPLSMGRDYICLRKFIRTVILKFTIPTKVELQIWIQDFPGKLDWNTKLSLFYDKLHVILKMIMVVVLLVHFLFLLLQ